MRAILSPYLEHLAKLGRSMLRPYERKLLSLALLVLGVDANHPHHAAPVDHLALVTNLFYRCPYFHAAPQSCFGVAGLKTRHYNFDWDGLKPAPTKPGEMNSPLRLELVGLKTRHYNSRRAKTRRHCRYL
jgi:hypothetical protein